MHGVLPGLSQACLSAAHLNEQTALLQRCLWGAGADENADINKPSSPKASLLAAKARPAHGLRKPAEQDAGCKSAARQAVCRLALLQHMHPPSHSCGCSCLPFQCCCNIHIQRQAFPKGLLCTRPHLLALVHGIAEPIFMYRAIVTGFSVAVLHAGHAQEGSLH